MVRFLVKTGTVNMMMSFFYYSMVVLIVLSVYSKTLRFSLFLNFLFIWKKYFQKIYQFFFRTLFLENIDISKISLYI